MLKNNGSKLNLLYRTVTESNKKRTKHALQKIQSHFTAQIILQLLCRPSSVSKNQQFTRKLCCRNDDRALCRQKYTNSQ